MPTSNRLSSTWGRDNGERRCIVTAGRMISGEVLRYRKGLFIGAADERGLCGSRRFCRTAPARMWGASTGCRPVRGVDSELTVITNACFKTGCRTSVYPQNGCLSCTHDTTIQRTVCAHSGARLAAHPGAIDGVGEARPADAEKTRLAQSRRVGGLAAQIEPKAEPGAAAWAYRLSADNGRELSAWKRAQCSRTASSDVLRRLPRCPSCVGQLRRAPPCLATGA